MSAAEPTKAFDIPVTQRAYSLRLSGNPNEAWREALWMTHEAVNRGAQLFGDWLLTLRGGISHELADRLRIGHAEAETLQDAIRDRRILLALSWLSVESADQAPRNYVIKDPAAQLRIILERMKVKDIPSWVSDCRDSLAAEIREDAVWVDRSQAFDRFAASYGTSRQDAEKLIFSLIIKEGEYFAPITENQEETNEEEKLAKSSNVARGWISAHFGTGEKNERAAIARELRKIARMPLESQLDSSGLKVVGFICRELGIHPREKEDHLEALRLAIGWKTGRPSAARLALKKIATAGRLTQEHLETLRTKFEAEAAENMAAADPEKWISAWKEDFQRNLGIQYVTGRNLIGEFSSMLDHAVRKVRSAHTWIRRAEGRRRSFEKDKMRLKAVPAAAMTFLDLYCEQRSETAGSIGGYRIRKRAVDGWTEVVKAWGALDPGLPEREGDDVSAAEKARIDKVAELQEDFEKFGDAQLFQQLASSGALCVWKQDVKADAGVLLDYVFGKLAEYNKTRFKVPAYRHPDPLLHPVFCDFGNSRWHIEYALHRTVHHLLKTNAEFEKLALARAEARTDRVAEVTAKLDKATRTLARAQAAMSGLTPSNDVCLGLWDGKQVRDFTLRWHCKRLKDELGSAEVPSAVTVPRADRFGRAVADANNLPVLSRAAFDEKEWNGRLQVPRKELRHLWEVQQRTDLNDRERAEKMQRAKERLPWLLTFSPRLKPQGPAIEYGQIHGFKLAKKSGSYFLIPPSAADNKKRGDIAKLGLCRLPGLRLLAADLGHRYAAAGAVWQTLSAHEFDIEIRSAKELREDVQIFDLYAVRCRRSNGERPRTIVYRRLAGDRFPDGSPHPAPWAKLERQFVVKLQGEDEPARAASREESNCVQQFYAHIGRHYEFRSRDISQLMAHTVRAARIGLRRHADLARIAFAMTHDAKQRPGGDFVHLSEEQYKIELTRALQRWFNLATAENWQSDDIQRTWREFEERLNLPLLQLIAPEERKKRAIRDAVLVKAAGALIANPELRMTIGECFASLWQQAEPRWQSDLRWLRRWLLPVNNNPAIRHVGGLSLNRIASIQQLYRLHKAHYQRLTPQGPQKRNGRPVTATEDFFSRAQENMERMRENRVKQLASRLVEAALGLGAQSHPGNYERLTTPRFQACHVIVVENLESYRPDQSRTRRENRALMTWSAAQVLKYLSDSCSLYGLLLRQVPASYTSRQDSRTAVPGICCKDVPVLELVIAPWWKHDISKARARCDQGRGSPRDRLLIDLMNANWDAEGRNWTDPDGSRWHLLEQQTNIKPGWQLLATAPNRKNMREPSSVRLPDVSGDLFVAAPQSGEIGTRDLPARQRDMNAAANIGLRAVLDPDWEGRWWYVPCDAECRPLKKKIEGSSAFQGVSVLRTTSVLKKDSLVNLWRSPSARHLAEDSWASYKDYWNAVEKIVVNRLRAQIYQDPGAFAAAEPF